MSEFVVRHKVDAQRFSLYAKTHTHACTHMHTEFALSSNANAHLLDRCVSKSMPRSVSADPNSGKFFAPARLSFHETVATVESCVCVYAAACFGLPSRLYNVLLSEALMPVPPGPAQPGSAPVFGRYAGFSSMFDCRRPAGAQARRPMPHATCADVSERRQTWVFRRDWCLLVLIQ